MRGFLFIAAKLNSWSGTLNKKVTGVHARRGVIRLTASHGEHFYFLSTLAKTLDKSLCNRPSSAQTGPGHHIRVTIQCTTTFSFCISFMTREFLILI